MATLTCERPWVPGLVDWDTSFPSLPPAAPHPSLPAPALPPRHVSPALQVCFITNTYMNLFNSWVLFYMSRIFSFAALQQPCPLRRNSSGFGEEGEVEKRRDLGRGENRKEGHELEDKRKSRGCSGRREGICHV